MLRLAMIALLLAAAALAASVPVEPAAPSLDDELRLASREVTDAKAEQERLEAAAARARDDVTRLRARQLAAAQAIAAAEAEISEADARARIARARLDLQRRQLAAEQAPLSSLLGGLAIFARRPPIAFLADSRSPDDLVKFHVLLAAVTPAIRERTAGLAAEVERTGRLQSASSQAVQSLAARRDELRGRRDSFASLEAQADELARSRGSAALGAGDVTLASEERQGQLQRAEVSSIASARLALDLAALGPAPLRSTAGGGVEAPFPFILPAEAAVTDGLGSVSSAGIRSKGVTLATRRGSELVAPATGTIAFSGPFRGYDGIIIVDHGGGWKSVLINAGSRLSKGQAVHVGQPLGTALGPVEIELQHRGEAVSPALIAGSSAMVSNRRKGG